MAKKGGWCQFFGTTKKNLHQVFWLIYAENSTSGAIFFFFTPKTFKKNTFFIKVFEVYKKLAHWHQSNF